MILQEYSNDTILKTKHIENERQLPIWVKAFNFIR